MILCCGEALIDMIPQDLNGRTAYVPHAGGAVFNTAIGLGRLGIPTGFLTGLSRDLFGTQLQAALEHSHVDTRHVIVSDRPTTLAFVALENGQARYTFYDENTAGRSLSPDHLPALAADVQTLYFGGISLISEPCAEFYAALAACEAGTRTIMLDPNIRPGFIRDDARYRARLDQMVAVCDILKVSDEDLDWIAPTPRGIEAKVASLSGPRIVVVTRGAQGAQAYVAGEAAIEVPAQRVNIVDTVGAGDTFNAGVLAELARRNLLTKSAVANIDAQDMRAALQHGAAVAAVTVSRAGANPPWAEELA